MTIRTSALVVGGGPAGATAARFLSEGGVETILVERDFSYVKPCGGCIPSIGFEEFDLPDSLIRKKINRVLIAAPSGYKLEIDLKGGQLYITERGVFDSFLRSLASQKGAQVIEGRLIEIEKKNNRFISRIIGKSDGKTITVHSDYLLAADGVSFTTGRCLKIKKPAYLYTVSSYIHNFETDICEFWFGSKNASNFYSWIFPLAGRASIGTGGLSSGEMKALFDSFIKRRFASSGSINFSQPKIFPLPIWRGGPYSFGKALFLGDTAALVMPTTYEGIYYAMKSGQIAATSVLEGMADKYSALLGKKLRYRFLLMDIFRKIYFRNDASIEKWVKSHSHPEIQEMAINFFLRKKSDIRSLIAYLKALTCRTIF